jgi:hypothetical protein
VRNSSATWAMQLATETEEIIMHPTKLLVAIVTVLALSASLANAAPQKGKGYTVQKTAATQQDHFRIGY